MSGRRLPGAPICTIHRFDGVRLGSRPEDRQRHIGGEDASPQGERDADAPLGEQEALTAGEMLLSNQNVPVSDALIASFVKLGTADYVVTR